ncbi:hypothetical protein SAMN03159507_03576 [Pseudomonas sp. NFACC32-1]|uniref:hypothetical protein n=1 Tax=Pseudomonas TaxID=286 RepID=UPI0008765421|nr:MULTISPECIES: hypothetical protein [Pseudomonas]MDB6444488.1 hypothetical protein [Pseudomonas sp. 21TX0197]MDT8904123.1 hypothetical protein [Pseudomonas prosekii]NHN67820.1 hypothetical protein [Pseudomonas fluorescens]SCX67789.1 hypothetical protein SAMN03159507_03576 [Pseudomonas sp. NFACC32-1]SFX82989.1 hypothetical protein SAMN03159390_02726 [Pseudomonas sp. NFACC49-2]
MGKFLSGGSSGQAKKLEPRWTDNTVHNEVKKLVTSGKSVTTEKLITLASDDGWRTTVMIDLVSRLNPISGGKYYPGHAGLILWHTSGPKTQFYSVGIVMEGELDPEGVLTTDLSESKTLDLWFFTKKVSKSNIEKMTNRITALSSKTLTYKEFDGNRYNDAYNCHTIVDDILNAGGLSGWSGRPWSWLTPWAYSLSFGVTGWHSSVMYNTKNL